MRLKTAFGIALVAFIYLAGTIIMFGFGLDSNGDLYSSFPILYAIFFVIPLLVLLLFYWQFFSSNATRFFVLAIILIVFASTLLFSSTFQSYYSSGIVVPSGNLSQEIDMLNSRYEELNSSVSGLTFLTKWYGESNANLTRELLALSGRTTTTVRPTTVPITTTERTTTVRTTTTVREEEEEEYED